MCGAVLISGVHVVAFSVWQCVLVAGAALAVLVVLVTSFIGCCALMLAEQIVRQSRLRGVSATTMLLGQVAHGHSHELACKDDADS